jgi:organic radical activating enzyme
MFDLVEFNAQAISHDKVDSGPLLEHIRSFENVVLWGAANFGEAIGAYLKKEGIRITRYWDLRAVEINTLNGVAIDLPFTGNFDPGKTMVILCINNNVLKANAWNHLQRQGYLNSIKGEYLFSGAICPFTADTGVKAHVCIDPLICRFICCERLSSIVGERARVANGPKPGEPLHLVYVCVLVNSVCSLNCKHCVQYINNYPVHKRTNVPTERVCADIRSWLGAVDSIGGVSVMGGETFLHPGIHQIASTLAEQENFGLASFPTSGTVPLDPRKLEHFRDPRLSINFGNYKRVLKPRQLEIYEKNVELVKSMGLSHTEGNTMLAWLKPSTLYDLGRTPEQMTVAKQNCHMPPRNMQIKDGKIFPCDLGVAVNNIGLGDYPEDYVDVANTPNLDELREKIRAYIDKPYYRSCGHCNNYPETTEAMVQGHLDYTQPSSDY